MTLRRATTIAAAALVLVGLTGGGCSNSTAPATPADALAMAKGGKPGGGDSEPKGGTVVQGDLVLGEADAPAIASTCPTPGGFSGAGWAMVYGKSGCLIAGGLRSAAVDGEYAVTDDVVIGVQVEKGKNGRITHVRFRGQDVDGPDGIVHDTEWIAVAEPVVPTTAGFTLHVHARNVPLWRWNSHLERDGSRVEVVGRISIGDLVYPPQ